MFLCINFQNCTNFYNIKMSQNKSDKDSKSKDFTNVSK